MLWENSIVSPYKTRQNQGKEGQKGWLLKIELSLEGKITYTDASDIMFLLVHA